MIIKGITDECFSDYRKPSLYVAFPSCSFKCDKECGKSICQNSRLAKERNIEIDTSKIVERYLNNPITNAIVCGGLEPFDSWNELKEFIIILRSNTDDDIVIYTGYKEEELTEEIEWLKQYTNIIIKFGRFIPDDISHYDELLGVNLASTNQYSKRINK